MNRHLGVLLTITCSLALAMLVMPTASAEPVTAKLAPVADNWVNSCNGGWSDKNGSLVQLRLRGWDDGPRAFRSLLRFDLTGLAGKTVYSATLRVYWYQGHWDPPSVQNTVGVYENTGPWAETNSNWRYADEPAEWDSIDVWSSASPYYSGPGGSPGGGGDPGDLINTYTLQWTGSDWGDFSGEWLEFDVTDMVQDWVYGTADNNGFLLRFLAELLAGNTVYELVSRENALDEKPYLEVTYEDGSGGCAAAAPAEAATLGASQTSGSLSHLLIVLLPVAVVVGIKRMRRRAAK
jgi:hypothetical protein